MAQSDQLVKNIPIKYVPDTEEEVKEKRSFKYNPDVRFKYPDFLPHPYGFWRNAVREKLERSDMLKRRAHIDIPEFYVGLYNYFGCNIEKPVNGVVIFYLCIQVVYSQSRRLRSTHLKKLLVSSAFVYYVKERDYYLASY